MKRLVVISAALATVLGLGLAQDFRVGVSYDAGGKNDRSFNQSTYEGAQKAVKDLGVKYFDYEPSDPGQVGVGIRQFADDGFNFVLGVGFANEPSITKTAQEYKDVKFGVIDAVPCDGKCANAVGLVFREQEGSYLVGYIAGSVTTTGVVGFMGGMDIPLIHKFEVGYKAGAEAAMKDRGIASPKVLVNYVGTTPSAWNDPGKGKEIAASQASQGADIIYAAAGASGLGVKDYVLEKKCLNQSQLPAGVKFVRAEPKVPVYAGYRNTCAAGTSRPMFMIGVDANQNYLGDTDKNPATLNHVLTSMLKRVDVATYETIKSVKNGTFKGGVREFGLSNNGVGYAVDDYNKALIPPAVITKLEILKKRIIAGALKVPFER